MNPSDYWQTGLLFLLLLALSQPLGGFMAKVYAGERNCLSPLLRPVEHLLYRLAGVAHEEEMGWRRYAGSMLLFNGLLCLALLGLLLGQHLLPLNPQHLPPFSWPLAVNTAVSFMSNSNWQNYSGEQAASYATQMVGFGVHNFLSAATGMAILIALLRGFIRRQTNLLGNFWVDLCRGTLYILLPLALVGALLLVSQGVIQNFSPYKTVPLLQNSASGQSRANSPAAQVSVSAVTIPMGPVASQEAIKVLGSNGGGFFGANSAHPYENPTPCSNLLEILFILLLPASLTHTFGRMVGNRRQGWGLLAVMLGLLLVAFAALHGAEVRGNPILHQMGIAGANLEGKELRFGLTGSALFSVATAATSCGAVNSMHDSLTPFGGLIPLSLILLGEIVFGGVGSGLYTMLAFVVVAVFVAGLMIGRTPEYLGKKIEVREMRMALLTILIAGVVVLLLSGVASLLPSALAAMANPGAHGLSELLYAFASMANNNGSAFAGLSANSNFYNLAGAAAMLLGRFVPAVAMLAMAGGLAEKKYIPPTLGTLPTDRAPFLLWLVLVIVIVGALTFFPALALGPIAEELAMRGGQ